jgi:hypothetical protein
LTAPDAVTVLRAVDGAVLTKRVRRTRDGELLTANYDRGFWFGVEEVQVGGLLDLGGLLARLEHDPKRCVIRGVPLPGIDRGRCRRLLYPIVDDDGEEVDPTFEATPRRWLALDFDDLPTPTWNAEDLARRRQAIERDRAEHPLPWAPKSEDDGEDIDLAGDDDPAPIDPARDWSLVCWAAVSTLPVEFHAASAYWQMTSSAGIKPGIRLRLWYWLDRPVADDEAKHWLADAPVDRALYSPVQIHYTAAPIFAGPADDPVPVRSGWWWRHQNVVTDPELPAPEPIDVDRVVPWRHAGSGGGDRVQAYAEAALRAAATATAGTRHPTLMAVAVRLYSLADAGLLDHGEVTRRLLAAAEAPLSPAERHQRCRRRGGRPSENEQAVDWARAKAKAAPDLPEGFRP